MKLSFVCFDDACKIKKYFITGDSGLPGQYRQLHGFVKSMTMTSGYDRYRADSDPNKRSN